MTTPTYAQALTVPTVLEEEAALLSLFTASELAGWPDDAPQRQLLAAEAQALQFEMVQRALIALTASPAGLRKARTFLVAQGYSQTDAAAIVSGWVDVALEWYAVTRIPASKASWSIGVVSTTLTTIDAQTQGLFQADDGTFFLLAQSGSSVTLNSGNSFKGNVTLEARTAGSAGNVIAGTITHINSGPAGLSVDTGASQTLLVAGRDAESDEDALTRGPAKFGRIGAGWTRTSFDSLIPEFAPTVTRWAIDDSNPGGPGTVYVYLANASGPATTPEINAVQGGLTSVTVKPLGSGALSTFPASTYTISPSIILLQDGSNPDAIADATAALALLESVAPLGAFVDISLVAALARGLPVGTVQIIAVGDVAKTVTVNAPGFSGVEQAFVTGSWTIAPPGAVVVITPSIS